MDARLHNSTIKRKHCICKPDCDKWPTFGCYSYFYAHLPDDLKEKAGTKKKVQIRNKNRRISIAAKIRSEQRKVDGSEDQEIWYLLKKHEMTGYCSEEGCTNSTNKYSNEYYRWSICHVVPKKLIPSVATHPDNWIELCWQHHSEFDSTFEKAAKMKCFEEAKRKFELFKDLIPNEQMRKVNPYLLQSDTIEPTCTVSLNQKQNEQD